MPGFQLQGLYGAVLADNRMQTHGARYTGLASQRRIVGLDLIDELSRGYVAALPDTRWRDLGRRRRGTHAAPHATENAANTAAGYAPWDAGTRCAHTWLSFFFNVFDVLRGDFGRH